MSAVKGATTLSDPEKKVERQPISRARSKFLPQLRRAHFVGIGGSGMSGIAEILLSIGYQVTGSDVKESPVIYRLEAHGAEIKIGHAAENVVGADAVIVSSAIKPDNPEIRAARQHGIPLVPRAEMLAELMRLKHSIAVAGSHGKTTTTSLTAMVLTAGGLDPTVVIGGILRQIGTGALLGEGDYLVAEADESDGSFLKLNPTIAVVTNIDDDHLDYYGDMARLTTKFGEFANHVPFYGFSVLCIDDPRVRCIVSLCSRKVITYGLHPDADVRAENIEWTEKGCRYRLILKGETLGTVNLSLFGNHNVLNSLGAAAIGLELKIGFPAIAEALEAFQGVDRRLQFKGRGRTSDDDGEWLLYDDYGHHPTEVEATLAAARRIPHRRLVVLFQPHRYSRTALLYDKFAASLAVADRLWLLPIYGAGEASTPGVSSKLIADSLYRRGYKEFRSLENFGQIADVWRELRSGDVVITLGAGDIAQLGEEMLAMR